MGGGSVVKVLATQARGPEFRSPDECQVNVAQHWKAETSGVPTGDWLVRLAVW